MSCVASLHAAPGAKAGGSLELADVFQQYFAQYRRTYGMTPAQRKAAWAIQHCRTPTLGGQRKWCQRCGWEHYVYHSCRNRHCPKCQSLAQAAWSADRQRELLPVPYFHNVFTLPHELNAWILWSERNQRALLGLLFRAVSQTLLRFVRKSLGGQAGFTLVLHTWDQQLRAHFHLHCLIASGALSHDKSRWIAGGAKFLFPVHALSKVFRAKFLDGLARLLEQGDLDSPHELPLLAEGPRLLNQLRQQEKWSVYSKAPFASPRKLLGYLARYTHRIAISNQRLITCQDGQVSFTYRDRRDGDQRKTMQLPAQDFIRRFLQHVLPNGFMRIRHYGFLANRVRRTSLQRCRELLGVRQLNADPEKKSSSEWMLVLADVEVNRCPKCGEPVNHEVILPTNHNPSLSGTFDCWDTS